MWVKVVPWGAEGEQALVGMKVVGRGEVWEQSEVSPAAAVFKGWALVVQDEAGVLTGVWWDEALRLFVAGHTRLDPGDSPLADRG